MSSTKSYDSGPWNDDTGSALAIVDELNRIVRVIYPTLPSQSCIHLFFAVYILGLEDMASQRQSCLQLYRDTSRPCCRLSNMPVWLIVDHAILGGTKIIFIAFSEEGGETVQ